MGCGKVAGGVDRSAGGLEIRFAIRSLAIVVQAFALRLRNGIRCWFGAGRVSVLVWAIRFVIWARAIVVQGFALELRNGIGVGCGGRKTWAWVWKSVGVVRKK
jgi:hypothetical protein